MSGNDDCLNEEIINLGGARSRGTVEYEDYGDEDGQEEHLVLQWDEHICSNLSSLVSRSDSSFLDLFRRRFFSLLTPAENLGGLWVAPSSSSYSAKPSWVARLCIFVSTVVIAQ